MVENTYVTTVMGQWMIKEFQGSLTDEFERYKFHTKPHM